MPQRPRLARAVAVAVTGLLTAAGLLALGGCAGTRANTPGVGSGINTIVGGSGLVRFPASERKAAPVVSGTTLDGAALSTAGWAGQVVVVNFWASWCAPCRAEAPFLAEVARATAGQGVHFVGVAVKDDRGAAVAFQTAKALPYPSLFDQPGRVGQQFNTSVPVASIPTTLVIDRHGRVAARDYGGLTADQLRPVLAAIVAEPA